MSGRTYDEISRQKIKFLGEYQYRWIIGDGLLRDEEGEIVITKPGHKKNGKWVESKCVLRGSFDSYLDALASNSGCWEDYCWYQAYGELPKDFDPNSSK